MLHWAQQFKNTGYSWVRYTASDIYCTYCTHLRVRQAFKTWNYYVNVYFTIWKSIFWPVMVHVSCYSRVLLDGRGLAHTQGSVWGLQGVIIRVENSDTEVLGETFQTLAKLNSPNTQLVRSFEFHLFLQLCSTRFNLWRGSLLTWIKCTLHDMSVPKWGAYMAVNPYRSK